ncbi:DUF3644 domain-containing protein [Chryseobacterium aquaticum]|uniref:DUF3644 domain-containing protein n=1 Tax=Chryseobacterium aquaticum TaxID=452084 RepID=UPI002FC595F7
MKKTTLRRGKTKNLLESSIDCALLAVEIYNKPRAPFRVETFITNMIMAWSRLFQAHFNQTIGETYFYKLNNGRYELIDGEKKTWDLAKCIRTYGKLSAATKANINLFIKLRNKIEHRTINKDEIGLMIFGECQSLLYNYENELIKLFGDEYAMNESLAYSLQFSKIRTTKQKESSKQLLSSEYKDIVEFIKKYRDAIQDDIFNSQEFSIKLIQIPKITNTNKNDLAIEFVNLNSISEEDIEKYEKLTTIVKDKVLKVEGSNVGKLKPGNLIQQLKDENSIIINHNDHKCLLSIFKIRPFKDFCEDYDPFETNTKYCHYDEAHRDYLYQENWKLFLIHVISNNLITKEQWKENFKNKIILDISSFEL